MPHLTHPAAPWLLALLAALSGGCVDNDLPDSDDAGPSHVEVASSTRGAYEQPSTPDGWTLVVLPDTQDYAALRPEILEAQVDWLLAQRDALDIRMVVHVGDIVDEDLPGQWENARAALSKLSGKIPAVFLPGNHDFVGVAQARQSMMEHYFSPLDYLGEGEDGSFDAHGWNTYQVMPGPVQDWLFIGLEFAPRNEVLSWANQVMASHAGLKTVIATHLYLFSDGTRYDYERYGEAQPYNPFDYALDPDDKNDGEQIWQKLVRKHASSRLVLCGHTLDDGIARLASQASAGNQVQQVLANYQWPVVDRGMDRSYSGYLRVMRFYAQDTRVEVRTYSPWLEEELVDAGNRFTLAVDP